MTVRLSERVSSAPDALLDPGPLVGVVVAEPV